MKHDIVSRNLCKEGSKSIVFPSHAEYNSAAHKKDLLLTNQTV
jgi:hypothetical protein